MLAATKADFEPDSIDRHAEQPGEVGRLRAANVQRKPRQQVCDQAGLVRPQSMTFSPAKE
jgi:hypothetical protein